MKAMGLFSGTRPRVLCSIVLLLAMAPQIAAADCAALWDEREQAGAAGGADPGSARKRIGVAFMVFGGSATAVGAAVKFGEDVEGPGYKEDEYNTFNYAMMIGGAAMFALGTILLISGYEASRVMDSAYIDCDRDVTRVGVRFSF
jgi:hypothetical protein